MPPLRLLFLVSNALVPVEDISTATGLEGLTSHHRADHFADGRALNEKQDREL